MNTVCALCVYDHKAILTWRREGGLMPMKTCNKPLCTMARCKACKDVVDVRNADLRCDDCWAVRERSLRPITTGESQ